MDGVVARLWLWPAWLVTVVGALVTGYLGLREFVATLEPGTYGTAWYAIAYYDLQLFVLSSNPLDQPGPYPLLLEIARFAAPAAAIWAIFEAGHALFAGRYERWRISRRADNVIVVGATPAADVLAKKLHASSRRVIPVATGDPESLRLAGAAKAEALYAFGDDSLDSAINLVTAARAAEMGARRVYAQVSDSDLALALRARRLGLPDPGQRHVDVVHLDEVAARALMRLDGPAITTADAPSILVVGPSAFGRALVVELARTWRLASPGSFAKLPVTLVGDHADVVARRLRQQWPVVDEVCDITAVASLDEVAGPDPYRIYVCDDDEDRALLTVLSATRLWRGEPHSLVVRLGRLATYRSVFSGDGGWLLDDIGQRLRLVGLTELASDPDLIRQDLVERLAQTIHERYLIGQLQAGATPGVGAIKPWPDLDEKFRRSNRMQAVDIGRKLQKIGCTVAPSSSKGAPFSYVGDELERLSRHEHARWCQERTDAGWKRGERDDANKRHPDLVPWDELTEKSRNNDRQVIRDLPIVLAEAGLRVIRLTDPPA